MHFLEGAFLYMTFQGKHFLKRSTADLFLVSMRETYSRETGEKE